MKITILTLFPILISNYLETSIMGRAKTKGKVEYELIDIREFGEGAHQSVDDRPFGGGAGMVLRADVLTHALKSTLDLKKTPHSQKTRLKIILTSASGKPFNQTKARELSTLDRLVIVCGHYEGIDQRFIDKYVDEEISIGDFVLTGGELPALTITDAIVRLIPGVLDKAEATLNESFSEGLLEHPQYTRPQEFEGLKTPDVLLSGDHKKIAAWREEASVEKTKKMRPDLRI